MKKKLIIKIELDEENNITTDFFNEGFVSVEVLGFLEIQSRMVMASITDKPYIDTNSVKSVVILRDPKEIHPLEKLADSMVEDARNENNI